MTFLHSPLGRAYYQSASPYQDSGPPPPELTYLENIVDHFGGDLEALWDLTSITSVPDLSGNGWTMTVTGSGTIALGTGPTINGDAHSAVSASGSTRRLATVGGFTGASAANGRTIIVWCNLSGSSAGFEFLLGRATTSDGEIQMYSNTAGNLYAEAQGENGTTEIASPAGSTDMDDTGWNCCFAWWDPADDDVYIQLNTGAPTSEAGTIDINTDCASPYTVFASNTGGSPVRSGGLIALPMVINRVLTSGERASVATGVF